MPDLSAPNDPARPPLTAVELKAAYPKLCKCLDELDALRPASIRSARDEEPFIAWASRYNLTVDGIYGHGSTQCEQYCIGHLSAMSRATRAFGTDYDARRVQEAYAAGIASVRKRLMALLEDQAAQIEALG